MAAMLLFLFIIIDARADKTSDIIMGGVDGAFIKTDDSSVVQTIDDSDAAEETGDGLDWPDIKNIEESRNYTIVNDDNPLSAVYDPIEDGLVDNLPSEYVTYACKFDIEAMPYLEAMIDAARKEGFSIYVNSGYISYSYQSQIFNGTASGQAEKLGVSTDFNDPEYQLAVEAARKITRYPGTSEHQLGLAVDIVDGWHTGKLQYSIMNQDMFAWLDAHCAEYGFIKRYPTKKLLLTKLDESWHYRYVGVEAATFIMANDICFEEFYAHYDPEFTY